MAQSICVAFVTSFLYLLVQPRPENVLEAKTKWERRYQGGRGTPSYILNWTSAFLCMSGWAIG